MSKKSALALDEQLLGIKLSGTTPRLLLHCCCAPCASYVLEYLSPFFDITALYYNPNIQPREEYDKRASELWKLLELSRYQNKVDMIVGEYDTGSYDALTAPFLDEPEGGGRCAVCYDYRLEETAKYAKANGYDYFTTTLSVSPYKNASRLNEIGNRLAGEYEVSFLSSDFKKHDGYKRSIELSKLYGLYRQSYCGCVRSASGRVYVRNSNS